MASLIKVAPGSDAYEEYETFFGGKGHPTNPKGPVQEPSADEISADIFKLYLAADVFFCHT